MLTKTHSSQAESQLYIFEDNEAVINMFIKDRSPTKRHVSRTHRVALDWLLDRVNLNPKIQIKYLDTKHQLADIWTKGNFTRDEWNNGDLKGKAKGRSTLHFNGSDEPIEVILRTVISVNQLSIYGAVADRCGE